MFHFLGFAFLWTSSILVIGLISVTRNVFVQNLKPLCCNILLYGTQISCLAITPSPNMYFWQYTCCQYVLRGCCCHYVDICNLQLAIMVTRQKEKSPSHLHRSHKILATYTISYTLATLAKPPWQPAILEKKKAGGLFIRTHFKEPFIHRAKSFT